MFAFLRQVLPVQEIKIHEYFRHLSGLDNDIALLVLKTHVAFEERVAKVVLIEPNTALHEGSSLYVSGWGANNLSLNTANSLLISKMNLTDKLQCQKNHGSLITNSNFCAKYKAEERLNDNGGGALNSNLLVGILSYGATEEKGSLTAIFTNVSYFYWQVAQSKHVENKKAKL